MNGILDIEKVLADYGARQFNPPVKKARKGDRAGAGGQGGQGALVGSGVAARNPIHGAADTRRRLHEIINRTPQVMVKITGSAKSAKHLTASLDYISRNGQLELETDLAHRLQSRAENRELTKLWEAAAAGTMPETLAEDQKGIRQTFNIVLSMPYGTDGEQVRLAARDFAETQFRGNHSYVMAAHIDDGNPLHRDATGSGRANANGDGKQRTGDRAKRELPSKADKPLNPHVHLIVLARGRNGKRLNPRKADLQQWREVFADKLRNRGIPAAASKRQVRGAERTLPAKIVAMQERGATPQFWQAPTLEGNPFAEKAQRTQDTIAERYMRMAQALQGSARADDRTLAKALIERYARPAYAGLQRQGRIDGDPAQKTQQPISLAAARQFAAVYQSGLRDAAARQAPRNRTGLRDVSGLGLVRDQPRAAEVLLSTHARRDLGRQK